VHERMSFIAHCLKSSWFTEQHKNARTQMTIHKLTLESIVAWKLFAKFVLLIIEVDAAVPYFLINQRNDRSFMIGVRLQG
jgi:hypothetical protein